MKVFNVGIDFSQDPAGRYYSDGATSSGESFREDKLMIFLKNLDDGEKLKIILDDGVEAYGSSFLTEAFAGIVKYGYMDADTLLSKLEFSYEDPDFEFYKNKAIQYIGEAKYNSANYKVNNGKPLPRNGV